MGSTPDWEVAPLPRMVSPPLIAEESRVQCFAAAKPVRSTIPFPGKVVVKEDDCYACECTGWFADQCPDPDARMHNANPGYRFTEDVVDIVGFSYATSAANIADGTMRWKIPAHFRIIETEPHHMQVFALDVEVEQEFSVKDHTVTLKKGGKVLFQQQIPDPSAGQRNSDD